MLLDCSTSQITNGVVYTGFIVFFELQMNRWSSDIEPQTFKLLILHWFYKHIQAPMKPQKAPTRPPDGFQMANMRPQGAPRIPPSDIREAYVFLAPRGGLAEHVPNRKWCVLHWFYKLV